VARRNARHARCGNVTFLHADMTAPALLPPSSADWVISNHAMSFAVDKAAALRSARRVLTSNGTLVCTMLARNGTSGRQQCRHAPLPAGQVERSLADAGFHRAVTAECRVIGGDLVAITVVAHAGATPNSPAVNTKAEW
jgi:ubiquinone/menaquinone biosynthesis C-methylase UbiE